jgi:hypothetical protein
VTPDEMTQRLLQQHFATMAGLNAQGVQQQQQWGKLQTEFFTDTIAAATGINLTLDQQGEDEKPPSTDATV